MSVDLNKVAEVINSCKLSVGLELEFDRTRDGGWDNQSASHAGFDDLTDWHTTTPDCGGRWGVGEWSEYRREDVSAARRAMGGRFSGGYLEYEDKCLMAAYLHGIAAERINSEHDGQDYSMWQCVGDGSLYAGGREFQSPAYAAGGGRYDLMLSELRAVLRAAADAGMGYRYLAGLHISVGFADADKHERAAVVAIVENGLFNRYLWDFMPPHRRGANNIHYNFRGSDRERRFAQSHHKFAPVMVADWRVEWRLFPSTMRLDAILAAVALALKWTEEMRRIGRRLVEGVNGGGKVSLNIPRFSGGDAAVEFSALEVVIARAIDAANEVDNVSVLSLRELVGRDAYDFNSRAYRRAAASLILKVNSVLVASSAARLLSSRAPMSLLAGGHIAFEINQRDVQFAFRPFRQQSDGFVRIAIDNRQNFIDAFSWKKTAAAAGVDAGGIDWGLI